MEQNLKLIALDAEDLSILSAHMQDAVLLVGDMSYLPAENRFAAITNRFDWAAAASAKTPNTGTGPLLRHRAALRFERVLTARTTGINLKDQRQTLNVLALQFVETNAPAGTVMIVCAGGAAIELRVECLEAELKDLGAVWAARSKPTHGELPETDKQPK